MEKDNHQNRHRLAIEGLVRSYGMITKVLMLLPLPVRLPPLRDSIYTVEVNAGLVQAWTSIQDLPMDAESKEWAGLLILDWISACEWMFRDEEEPEEWHLILVGMQLVRILAGADLVLERLDSEE